MRTRTARSVSSDFEQTSLPCLFYFVSVPPLSASFLCYKVPFTRRLLSALRTESIWTLARRGSAYTQVHFGRCTFVARDSHTAVRIPSRPDYPGINSKHGYVFRTWNVSPRIPRARARTLCIGRLLKTGRQICEIFEILQRYISEYTPYESLIPHAICYSVRKWY